MGMTPRKSQANETKTRLLDRGVEMLCSKGYHGVGLKEILERVKVPKGSFYNYFKSKEHFGAEVIRHYARRQQALAREMLSDPGRDALETLQGFIRQCSASEGCLLGNLGGELGASHELCRKAMEEALSGLEDRFAELLTAGQAQGTVRTDLAAQDLAALILNSWEGALIRMKIERSEEPIDQLCSLIIDKFARAKGGQEGS